MKQLLAGLIVIFALSGCGSSGGGSSANGNTGSSATNYQAVPLPSNIDALFWGNSVTLQYGLAMHVSAGQNMLGRPLASDTTFVVVLSSSAITCGWDLSGDHQPQGGYVVLEFNGDQAGTQSYEMLYLNVHGGWLDSSGTAGTPAYGNLSSADAQSYSGAINYDETTNSTGHTKFVGNFTVTPCP